MIDFNPGALLLAFLIFTVVGFYIAYLYGHKVERFRWSEYLLIIFWPILFIIVAGVLIDTRIISLYVLSAFVGFFVEYSIGFTWHKVLNRRLWYYNRLSVQGYTSLLTIPIWGGAALVFWLLGKILGL